MNIFFFMRSRKPSIALVTVSFSAKVERKKGRFIIMNLSDDWYESMIPKKRRIQI